jgi:hypothetical protein
MGGVRANQRCLKRFYFCRSSIGGIAMPILLYIAMWSWALGVASCGGVPTSNERES